MYYSKITGGFYTTEIHGDSIPADAVEITRAQHLALRTAQAAGKVIVPDDNGYPVAQDPPAAQPLSAEELRAWRVAAVQRHMDVAAQSLGYDDIQAAVTYADEPAVPRFQAEGQAFRAWRSRVWEHCYQVLDDVQSGVRAIPGEPELLAELPALVLPT